jgi:predicted small integral membrane protein
MASEVAATAHRHVSPAAIVTPRNVARLALIAFALFPALWGFLGVLNDATDFNDTLVNAVKPMLEMTNTYGNPLQQMRAITEPWAATVALIGIMTVEGLAGLFGIIGLASMVLSIGKPYASFSRGKAWMMLGCLCAVLVWGVGFMVVAGDWFLSWEAKTMPLSNQLGGMIYFLPNALGLVFASLHREEIAG